ncbi:hypothetical protein [Chondromyces apiculatus]|uniref:Type II secretion system protein GspE N-terminal domain-containing protein n=1 Tax=Chondromyces apiculatus DSM 436 TaxID=1192034 RepID=A0A017THA5_9BACT|nr:hypothetical protein [Chondromyces apiculatus]EYF07986.1 Hypothetical protein CAP_7008 [Chondromyces apiculatus DSM 436]
MSIDLGRVLVETGILPAAEVEAALFLSVVRGIPFARALVDRGAITEQALEAELDRRGGLALRQVLGSRELFTRLPRALCRRLGAVPTRLDTASGTVDIAVADPLDRHLAAELGFHLGTPVRLVRAPMAAIEEAIRTLELDERQAPSTRLRPRRVTPAFPHGAPQSTIPPPPSEDIPIPLVRRVSAATSPPEQASTPVSTARSRSHEGADPRPAAPATLRGAGARLGGSAAGSSIVADANDAGPAISFPSTPPPSAWDPSPDAEESATSSGNVGEHAPTTLPQGRLRVSASDPYAPPSPSRHTSPGPSRSRDSSRGSHVPPAPPSAPHSGGDLRRIMEAINTARTRDDIVMLALEGIRRVAPRAALFTVKRGAFQGYTCTPEFGYENALREVAIPTSLPSILATATATGMYLGPIPGTPAHEPLLSVMGAASADVAAVAVRVAGRAVLVLVADDLDNTLHGTRTMDDLARVLGDALTRILATRF